MHGSPRQLALAAGLKLYDCGKPCPRCGGTERTVRKIECVPCRRKTRGKAKNRRYLHRIKTDPAARAKHNARNRRQNKTEAGRRRYREWKAHKRAADPQYRLRDQMRNAVRHRLTVKGLRPPTTETLIGCSYADLKAHLEQQFQPGMSWDNWTVDGWHVDHKIPLAAFDLTDRDQMLRANHYTNLQPLWALDNIAKGARVTP